MNELQELEREVHIVQRATRLQREDEYEQYYYPNFNGVTLYENK